MEEAELRPNLNMYILGNSDFESPMRLNKPYFKGLSKNTCFAGKPANWLNSEYSNLWFLIDLK